MTRAPAAVSAERIANWLEHQASGISPLCTWPERKTERAMLLDAAKKMRSVLTALDAATARAEEAEKKVGELDVRLFTARSKATRATAAEADAARLREAIELFTIGVREASYREGKFIITDDFAIAQAFIKIAALAPTPPAVATVAPEGPSEATYPAPSEEAMKVADEIRELALFAAHPHIGAQAVEDVARALDNLAGRGRA